MHELVAVVPHEVVATTRCVTGLVGRLDELEILVGPMHQALPLHARLEPDRLSPLGTLQGERAVGYSGLRLRWPLLARGLGCRGLLEGEHLVDRDLQLRREGIQRAYGGLVLAGFDLGDRAG